LSIPVQNLIRSATRHRGQSLQVLWLPKDGVFEQLLLPNLPHIFSCGHDVEVTMWDETMFSMPLNVYTLEDHNTFSMDSEFDLVVCNNRMKQWGQAKTLSSILHIPMLLIEHDVPVSIMKPEDIHISKQEKPANVEVMVNNTLNKLWNTSNPVIPYGIPDLLPNTHEYPTRENSVLIIGKFPEHDINIIKELQKNSGVPIKVLGNNHGLSEPIPYNEAIRALQTTKYYLNMSNFDNVPILLLLAMSAGCIPISNNNPMCKDILTDDTSYRFSNMEELYELLTKLQVGVEESKHVAANEVVMENYPFTPFIEPWIDTFDKFYDYVYTR